MFKNTINSQFLNNNKKEVILDSFFFNSNSNNYKEIHEYSKWARHNLSIDKAISINKKGLELISKSSTSNKYYKKKLLKNLGLFYFLKKDFSNSYIFYSKSTEIDVDSITSSRAYNKLGRILFLKGDFYNAEKKYDKAIDFSYRVNNHIYILNSIDAAINLKNIKTKRSLQKGIKILNKAVDLIETSKKQTTNIGRKITIYKHLGNLYCEHDQINKKEAKKNYNKSINIALKHKDSSSIAQLYNNIGYLNMKTNNDKAIIYLKKALEFNKSDKATKSITYNNISSYYLNKNKQKKALYFINQSIKTLINNEENLLNKNILKNNKYKLNLLDALIAKGSILNKDPVSKINNTNAIKIFNLSDFLLDEIRSKTDHENSKLYWQAKASKLYIEGIKACFNNKEYKTAAYFFEKNKAILLLENIYKHNNISKNDSLFTLKNDSLKTEKVKLYYANKVMNLEEIQKKIDNKTCIIEYILDEEMGYILTISKKQVNIYQLENIPQLNIKIKKYFELISTPFNSKKELLSFKNHSNILYKKLLPFFESTTFKNKKQLIIIPDHNLQNIPFETLKFDEKYLIQDYNISYAYSYSFLEKNKLQTRKPEKEYIGFAPYSFNYDELKTLPKSIEEVENAIKIFKGEIYTKQKATKANFTNNINNFKIISISSHANANDSISPWVAFKDGKINIEAIYNIDLQAELVVLNACKTGLGEQKKGEGVFSLARGFFYSGANSVISSLWNVNDKSNSQITSSFYRYLKKGETKSKALRQAKLDYLKTHSLSEASPYYWSSLVLIGDDSSIKLYNCSRHFTVLIILFLLVLFFILKKTKILGNKS